MYCDENGNEQYNICNNMASPDQLRIIQIHDDFESRKVENREFRKYIYNTFSFVNSNLQDFETKKSKEKFRVTKMAKLGLIKHPVHFTNYNNSACLKLTYPTKLKEILHISVKLKPLPKC